jgi:predicted TIM-barrel fold metal-dependent hydrolase
LRARRYLLEFAGPDNVVVGSNLNGWDEVPGRKFVEELGLSPSDEQKVMAGNAAKIFHLDGVVES